MKKASGAFTTITRCPASAGSSRGAVALTRDDVLDGDYWSEATSRSCLLILNVVYLVQVLPILKIDRLLPLQSLYVLVGKNPFLIRSLVVHPLFFQTQLLVLDLLASLIFGPLVRLCVLVLQVGLFRPGPAERGFEVAVANRSFRSGHSAKNHPTQNLPPEVAGLGGLLYRHNLVGVWVNLVGRVSTPK